MGFARIIDAHLISFNSYQLLIKQFAHSSLMQVYDLVTGGKVGMKQIEYLLCATWTQSVEARILAGKEFKSLARTEPMILMSLFLL